MQPKSSWKVWLIWTLLSLLTGAGGVTAVSHFGNDTEGEVAKVVVKAPTTARVGQLVVLDASESYVDSFKWQVTPGTENFEVIEGGKRAFFSGERAGKYTFWVAGALDKTVDLQPITVEIEGEVLPGPGPTGLEAKLRDWLKLVKSESWAREATVVSASFHSIGKQIGAGVLRTPEDVIKATAVSNSAALGAAGPAWAGFGEELRKELNSRSAAGSLSDLAAHEKLWLEIAQLMEKIANEGK